MGTTETTHSEEHTQSDVSVQRNIEQCYTPVQQTDKTNSVISVEVNPFAAAKAMEKYGPWAVVVLLAIGIFLLYRAMDNRMGKMALLFERSNKQFLALIEKLALQNQHKRDKKE